MSDCLNVHFGDRIHQVEVCVPVALLVFVVWNGRRQGNKNVHVRGNASDRAPIAFPRSEGSIDFVIYIPVSKEGAPSINPCFTFS